MREIIQTIANKYDIAVEFENDKLTPESRIQFINCINWHLISNREYLTEEFIREFKDYLIWEYISFSQKLSEEFMEEFQDFIIWSNISVCQVLSESFIKKYKNRLDLKNTYKYQRLSDEFVLAILSSSTFIPYSSSTATTIFDIISYQKLSKQVRDQICKNHNNVLKNNWLYKSNRKKIKYIRDNTDYDVIDNKYIIAYKSVRYNYRSLAKPNFYLYEIGKTYTSHCDCNINNEDSFGLSAWTKSKALDYYCPGRLLKVKINIKDIGTIVQKDKIRCFKFEILEDVTQSIE